MTTFCVNFNRDAFVKFGQPFIFESVDESNVDPIINNLLDKAFLLTETGTKQILLGENMVDFDDNFRLYQTSQTKRMCLLELEPLCNSIELMKCLVTCLKDGKSSVHTRNFWENHDN